MSARDASTRDGTGIAGWPLAGIHRVEASAGTGKTFALALLHTRLIVERGLKPRQILAVTYTNAATQELRERLRRQVGRAAELAARSAGELAQARESKDAGEASTAAIIERQLRQEPRDALALRLARAAAEIDLTAVFTIHVFCQRVLADHALASGEPLLPRELVANEQPLHQEVALDVFRRWTRDAHDADALRVLCKTPGDLAWDLYKLVGADALFPVRAAIDEDALRRRAGAADALRAAWRENGADARAALDRAYAAALINRSKLSEEISARAWTALDAFAADASLDERAIEMLERFTPDGLRDRARSGCADRMPVSPVFDAIDEFVTACGDAKRAAAQLRANLLHDVRDYASARLDELKRERSQVSFDDLVRRVEAALRGGDGDALAASLQRQYPAALVDEFQDTDARQWSIFRRIYREARCDDTTPTLFLVGDPKQAIFRFRGGDVHTYHRAGADAESTETLMRNFRSRPSMIDAVAATFALGGEFPFADAMTRFPPVVPGGGIDDAALTFDGTPAAALHLWNLPLREGEITQTKSRPAQIRVDRARDLAAAATAARIRELLADVRWQLHGERIRPGDIAVLVSRNDEAMRVQRELAARGIPSVTAARESRFASEEAGEIMLVLEALLASGDEGRLRAALATVLIGEDAPAIDALSREEAAHHAWLDRFQMLRERWERFGPLPVLAELAAASAPRLLALADGERRLTNYLQLAEDLQEARTAALGTAGQADWLARRIAAANPYDDEEQLRLESDADRVRIMTLHKAKGLEFNLVFVPFAMFASNPSPSRGLGLIDERIGDRIAARANMAGLDDEAWSRANDELKRETLAEQLRLLYVGLTRARHAAWLVAGAINGCESSALAWLFGRGAPPATMASDAVDAALEALAAASPRAIVRETFPDTTPPDLAAIGIVRDGAVPPLRDARRTLRRDWWVHSFSQLAREDGAVAESGVVEIGAEDEPDDAIETDPSSAMFAGPRFGNALHLALENADFAVWRGWRREAAPASQHDLLRGALSENGYASEDAIAGGSRVLAGWMRETLNVRLPEGVRLADLPAGDRRGELEFHFALRAVPVARVVDLLHEHGILALRNGFGTRERLEGLMTGSIDLVYRHGERLFLLDYKTNRLPDYSPAGLERAMRDNEYDLQYLIYALALHRWQRFRRADYDYDAHFGGVRYLFCRGIDAAREDSPGVFATRPPRALIEAFDALLAPVPQEAA